jgi:HEPN domain-containing protein
VSSREVNILRGRAAAFMRHAELALRDGEYDLSCFASEQASQLFVKSVMLEVVGEMPRVHGVREMLAVLVASVPEAEEPVSEFVKGNRDKLRALDDAYISSRYLPSTYQREDAEELVETARRILRLGEEMLRKCRR